MLSYSRILGHAACLQVITPIKTNAFSLSLDYLENLNSIDWQSITDVAILTFLVIMFIIIIKITWFRRHIITTHYGRCNGKLIDNTGWTIILNIVYCRVNLCNVINEHIYLRIPVTSRKLTSSTSIGLVNCCLSWYVKDVRGKKVLRTNEDIHLFSIDESGNRNTDDWEAVRIAIDNIQWKYDPIPTALGVINNYGLLMVSLAKDQTFLTPL